jgi:acyl-CoA synthetase (AMP-forming)/AMP-acid ligase II
MVLAASEPVRPTTVENFLRRFAPLGLRATAFTVGYGLAEATLGVTLMPLGEGPRLDRVARGLLETDLVAEPSDAEDARVLVDNGPALSGVKVAIRDDAGADLPDRRVGEVHVWSSGLMEGYYNDPQATAALMTADGGLRTGDLGYLVGGRLFIVGRIKDMIIRAGRKYHPADLEAIAETDPAVRGGSTACFYVEGNEQAPERIVMLVEPRDPAQAAAIAGLVRGRVMTAMGLRVDEVVPVPQRSLPKTTSGKIQRGEARKRWLAGELKGLTLA